jgi:hypothetical protein
MIKINVTYVSRKWYRDVDGKGTLDLRQWRWYFRTYKNVWGFHLRVFGVHFNIREKNATAKLINIFRERYNKDNAKQLHLSGQ